MGSKIISKTSKLLDIDKEAFGRIRRLRIGGQETALIRNLTFMAQYKYDSYEVYNPVKRFLPSLLEWLTQFQKPSEKETALRIVRCLLFLSRKEILELSHVVYQKILHELLAEITGIRGLDPFDYSAAYRELRTFLKTKCVFVGMSDGAQIDYFRRHSSGMIENDQVVPYYKLDKEEIKELARSRYAFLIDDMCLSGTTFVGERHDDKEAINGQLARFLRKWSLVRFKTIYYCPYVITEMALRRLQKAVTSTATGRILGRQGPDFRIVHGMLIPRNYSILNPDNKVFGDDARRAVALCRKYYDHRVENAATLKGGGTKFGFGSVGIFLVRYNNTPNDTPSIIWNPMPDKKALFRRLVRHYK